MDNNSTLTLLLETPNETLSSLETIASDTGKISKARNVSKEHGQDETSIRVFYLNQLLPNHFT